VIRKGVIGQLLLLGLAATLSMPLLAAFPELQAALGPPSVSLLVGAFVFGLTMQIADGCGSGTLYKAGMGVPLNMGILPLFALGSFIGSAHLDRWLALGQTAPVGLVDQWGAGPALAATWAVLIAAGLGVRAWAGWGKAWLDKRWVRGALALALLAALNLVIAGQPWGVVYGFGLWAAKLAQAAGLFDPTANCLLGPGRAPAAPVADAAAGRHEHHQHRHPGRCAVGGGGQAQPSHKALSARQWAVGLAAGFLMGYSSRLAFGCNVGAMLSGISTGSVHGWIWVPLAFAGTLDRRARAAPLRLLKADL
jgi:uncharacterized membrane protein YedE/YeeE